MIRLTIQAVLRKLGYEITKLKPSTNKIEQCFLDQAKLAGTKQALIIFDIGAHKGETAYKYLNLFPNSNVYAFEPFPSSFEHLKQLQKEYGNLNCENIAITKTNGAINLNINNYSATNSILPISPKAKEYWGAGLENTQQQVVVQSKTLTQFCREKEIRHIDILKIDTQGTEGLVLKGAADFLEQRRIKMVYLEVLIVPTYQGQTRFDEVCNLLFHHGFSLFDFYNKIYFHDGSLMQFDALFLLNNQQ